jgi:2-polyprenyl-3-methyl-5-hydroxy-6-metoxy-1,4-benzoquinol methylase
MAVITNVSDISSMSRPVHEPTGERMVPESADLFTFWEHVYRYAFASRFVKGKRVLDIACGEGYGAAALQKAGAASVTGVDISEAVCFHARRKYGIDTRQGAADKIPLGDGSVDVVVSFETIEHVPHPSHFLDECFRVLGHGGRLIISTPNKNTYGQRVQNPYHCSEMTEEEFTAALRSRFHDCRFYTQRPISAAWYSLRTFASDGTMWMNVPGFGRVHRILQNFLVPEATNPPTQEQRESVLDLIARVGRSPRRLSNPFVLRPKRNWNSENPMYLIAIAIR